MEAVGLFLERFIAQRVYRACARTNYKIVPLSNMNKYLHCGASETEVYYINISVNNGNENYEQKTL